MEDENKEKGVCKRIKFRKSLISFRNKYVVYCVWGLGSFEEVGRSALGLLV